VKVLRAAWHTFWLGVWLRRKRAHWRGYIRAEDRATNQLDALKKLGIDARAVVETKG
jgi:uncharacterized protein (DUF934 family)